MGGMTKQAILHRMVMPGHICPYGLKAKYLLERRGFHGVGLSELLAQAQAPPAS